MTHAVPTNNMTHAVPTLELGALVTVEAGEMTHGGECVARLGSAVVFVRGAIPGETVQVRLTEKRAKYWRAVTVDVVAASEHRVDHYWPLGAAEQTGGAGLGHIALSHQRELKQQILATQIRRIGGEALAEQIPASTIEVCAPDECAHHDGWYMRSRINVEKLDTGFGMHGKRGADTIYLDSMPLAARELERLELFSSRWDGAISPGTNVRALATSGGDVGLVYGGKYYVAPDLQRPAIVQERVRYAGKTYSYQVAADGFWQVHKFAPQTLVRAALEQLQVEQGMNVSDLYCGSGLFTVPLADAIGDGGAVLGVEASVTAIANAQENLRPYPWARALARGIDEHNVGDFVRDADVILADPARAGLKIPVVEQLIAARAERIVLISCDAASMARDLGAFVNGGMQVQSFQAFDIFPHTHHVETVALLSRV